MVLHAQGIEPYPHLCRDTLPFPVILKLSDSDMHFQALPSHVEHSSMWALSAFTTETTRNGQFCEDPSMTAWSSRSHSLCDNFSSCLKFLTILCLSRASYNKDDTQSSRTLKSGQFGAVLVSVENPGRFSSKNICVFWPRWQRALSWFFILSRNPLRSATHSLILKLANFIFRRWKCDSLTEPFCQTGCFRQPASYCTMSREGSQRLEGGATQACSCSHYQLESLSQQHVIQWKARSQNGRVQNRVSLGDKESLHFFSMQQIQYNL